jgi:hypothetical protein
MDRDHRVLLAASENEFPDYTPRRESPQKVYVANSRVRGGRIAVGFKKLGPLSAVRAVTVLWFKGHPPSGKRSGQQEHERRSAAAAAPETHHSPPS